MIIILKMILDGDLVVDFYGLKKINVLDWLFEKKLN